ncbi:amidohydrolase family protein [Chelatococcus sp. GCM10030263]|uniref:amidohydrolase family protein n=1 Tax=Chelatococcus sp. GCM10030263 TaxID=3273387 RepID=UPI00361CFDAF
MLGICRIGQRASSDDRVAKREDHMSGMREDRRRLLIGAAALAGLGSAAASAQPQTKTALRIIDFHNHFVGPAFQSNAGSSAPASQSAHWQKVNRNLSDPQALLASIDTAGIAARVVNTPLEFLKDADGGVSPDLTRRVNDQLAELVARHRGRLYGLATIDAFTGEDGARELIRAVRELGLRGAFLESARNDLLLDAPQARPTLAAAAAIGVPVFVHPLTDAALRKRLGRYGRLGTSFNRGTINGAALIALIESGTFDELPSLRVVVTTLAMGAVLMAGASGEGKGRTIRRDAPTLTRRHVYIDTMGLNPTLIRSAIDTLGADHVLTGTDWPIFVEPSVADRLPAALAACELTPAEQQMVASGNALSLLGGA